MINKVNVIDVEVLGLNRYHRERVVKVIKSKVEDFVIIQQLFEVHAICVICHQVADLGVTVLV